jgi:hypothetical protein
MLLSVNFGIFMHWLIKIYMPLVQAKKVRMSSSGKFLLSKLPPQLVKMLFAQFQQLPLDDRYSNSPAKWLQCPISQNTMASHLRRTFLW